MSETEISRCGTPSPAILPRWVLELAREDLVSSAIRCGSKADQTAANHIARVLGQHSGAEAFVLTDTKEMNRV